MSEIAESFASSLSELTVNSKPHINMLTMLADDHQEYAGVITETILSHLEKVRPEVKLPVLYLIDSIVKNVGKGYINLFSQSIVSTFSNTFEKVDEKTREQMFKLRQTWSEVFPVKIMFALDTKVQKIDPAWPVTAPPSTVHLNPKFFKSPDALDSKSLTPINQADMPHESRSRHRKSKSYSRSRSVTNSTHSKKAASNNSSSSADSVPVAKLTAPPPPEQLREQMIMKQKLLLELQQKKLKLELLQTQAQLEEQQKQLEKHSINHKATAELSKLQKMVSEEEAKLKTMSKNLKKQVQLKKPKLQQIHRVTSEMKAQKVTDISKVTVAPESMVKQSALLELSKEETGSKISKPLPPKSKVVHIQHQPVAEKPKVVAVADPIEDAPPPVRIAPVSSQLINAALTFGRNPRDPRIRQMSSRIESQLNASVPQTPITPAPSPIPPPVTNPVKKPEGVTENKNVIKPRKDKKSSSHQHKEQRHSKSSEEDSKNYSHSISSSRNREKSSNRSSNKPEKSPPSKKLEENPDKTKAEELFTFTKSKSAVKARLHIHSPSKSHNKRDKPDISDFTEITKTSYERVSRIESSPKRSKLQENWLENDDSSDFASAKHVHKLNMDIAKSQNIRHSDTLNINKASVLADSSSEMPFEDIEKIVRHPDIVTKPIKQIEVGPKSDEFVESPKSSDDSIESKFDDIIKNPSKNATFDRTSKVPGDKSNLLKAFLPDIQTDISLHKDEIKTVSISEKANELIAPKSPEKVIKTTINRNMETYEKPLDLELIQNNSIKVSQQKTVSMPQIVPDAVELDNDIIPRIESLFDHEKPTQPESIFSKPQEIEVSTTLTSFPDYDKNTKIISQERRSSEEEKNIPEPNLIESSPQEQPDSLRFPLGTKMGDSINSQTQIAMTFSPKDPEITENLSSFKISEKLALSPKKTLSPVKLIEPMEIIHETNEDPVSDMEYLPQNKSDRRHGSPVQQEKNRKGEKPTLMEQVITDAETHESSPSPPPPPAVSDKFKEIKQSSLSRLRRVGRSREDQEDSESPEPADVDLRTQIQPPSLTKDLKNEVLGLGEKDVDLRNLPGSPTKKRPSMEKLLDIPPAKKSKAEVMDELFGSEDVDLRPVLCPPPPSPPPPPVISSSPPPDAGGERLWARYKQAKPDTYKAKYTPSRRDRAPSVDRFGRTFRHSVSEDGNTHSQSQSRNRMNFEDIDMRAQPTVAPDYDHIIRQAINQHQRGDLNYDAYKRVLTEVVGMSEKQKLEEAQRLEHADNQPEQLDPISDDDISGGSLSGVEDAPSPTASYSGGEDTEDPLFKKTLNEDKNITATEPEKILSERHGDVDIRMPPADVDIRIKIDYQPKKDQEVMPGDEKLSRKSRGVSPYSRKPGEPEHERYRSRRDELKALRREKKARREEDDLTRYRKPRYSEDSWESHSRRSQLAEKAVDMDSPRVPPLPQYDSDLNYREPTLPQFTKEPDVGSLRPGPALAPWDQPRMAAPAPGPWMTPPLLRGPPGMGMRPQDRFMGPRWRHNPPGMFDSDPRFNRFRMPPIPPRFPPLVPCEVPPTDPAVLKLIEEDPTKSINIDGMPRDIRFYGSIAVALMNWDDPCEVTFQPGQRRVIIDDRDNIIVHFNAPPIEVLIDGQSHRIRFGAPTRELYIDNQWYEAYFGGPPVTLDIAGKPHTVQLEGPPPAVRPGVQRKDLVVGRVTLVIDAEMLFTVFLDAKPQKFEVKGVAYIIRFVEALQKTVINGVAFKSDFGGLPKPIILNGTKHFFRLTALPRGVTPGFLTIVNMEGGRLPSPPTLPAPPQLPASLEQAVDFKPELKADPFLQPPMPILPTPPMVPADMLTRDVDKAVVPPPPIPPLTMSAIEPLKPPPAVNSLDLLANLMPVPEPSRAVEYNYSVENENSNHKAPSTTAAADTTTSAPILGGEINVTELLQKLMATGIVPSLDKPKDKTAEKQITADTSLIKPVDFRKPDTLKIRQSALVSHLYSGIQCNSCGVRFPPEQTMKYSQHLDWHFRQNRRDKDSTRTAQTRRYYYDVNDWVQFEEIEDLEERAQPWFEMQEGDAEEEEHPQVLVSVRSADYPDEAACFICNDKFESFYNEEKEEWHLRNAVDQDGKLVHPVCLEDQRAAAEKPIVVEDIDITEDEPKEEDEVKEKEETPSKIEDDDDIMEVTDIEFIKPVFPVEDLTVSDSESVADDTEEKPKAAEEEVNEKVEEDQPEEKTPSNTEDVDADTTTTEVNDLPQEPEESKEEESEVIENDSKSEDTQDDLVILDKGEDSALSTAEILEVVRNIKKDPDILGGEYEEIGLDPNIEIKKEKGEVPLPQPVVDTTHTSVTCLIDGNVEFEETPPQINVGGPTKIKINITKPSVQTATKETTKEDIEVVEDEARNTASPATKCLALVNQPPPPGEEPVPLYVKPKLIGRKLQDLPPVLKGSELSGLCSIM